MPKLKRTMPTHGDPDDSRLRGRSSTYRPSSGSWEPDPPAEPERPRGSLRRR